MTASYVVSSIIHLWASVLQVVLPFEMNFFDHDLLNEFNPEFSLIAFGASHDFSSQYTLRSFKSCDPLDYV